LHIAWTTVSTQEDADRIASEVIARGFAACVEITRVASHYRWEGRAERAEEFRLAFKCLPPQLKTLEVFVLENHPYETPEWIVIRAEHVSEKYLSWAEANSTRLPL
jgi:periplasmic divalent cation tolerance protein